MHTALRIGRPPLAADHATAIGTKRIWLSHHTVAWKPTYQIWHAPRKEIRWLINHRNPSTSLSNGLTRLASQHHHAGLLRTMPIIKVSTFPCWLELTRLVLGQKVASTKQCNINNQASIYQGLYASWDDNPTTSKRAWTSDHSIPSRTSSYFCNFVSDLTQGSSSIRHSSLSRAVACWQVSIFETVDRGFLKLLTINGRI